LTHESFLRFVNHLPGHNNGDAQGRAPSGISVSSRDIDDRLAPGNSGSIR
jgi:hypothetical protein